MISKYELLKPLVMIAAGLIASDASAAMLTAVQGDVQVDTGSGFRPAGGAISVETGHKVQIGNGGAAQLVFPDGCIFTPAEGGTMAIGAQSPCAIRASYPRPSYVGGAASLYTHAITAPSKKKAVKQQLQTKIRQKPQLNNARWTTTTQPAGLVNQPLAINPTQAGQLPGSAPIEPTTQVQAPAAVAPQLPSPVFASGGAGLSTGMIVAGGVVAAAGGAALIVSATQNREKKSASP